MVTISAHSSDEESLSSVGVAASSSVEEAESSTLVSKSSVGVKIFIMIGILSDTKNLETIIELAREIKSLHGDNPSHDCAIYVGRKNANENLIECARFTSDAREMMACSYERCETSSEADQRTDCSPQKFVFLNSVCLSGSSTAHDNGDDANDETMVIAGVIQDGSGLQTIIIQAERSGSVGATRRALCAPNASTSEQSISSHEDTGLPVEDAEENKEERMFIRKCESQQPLWVCGIQDYCANESENPI